MNEAIPAGHAASLGVIGRLLLPSEEEGPIVCVLRWAVIGMACLPITAARDRN